MKRKKFDRVICLGDFVGYAADPNKVLDRFRTFRRPTFAIRGNHDKVVSGVEEGDALQPARARGRPLDDGAAVAARTWSS